LESDQLISIIIPCKEIDVYTKQCVEFCKKLEYGNFEILLLPDDKIEYSVNKERVRVIPTGSVIPGKKRNIGITNAKGKLCAFIDSDAFPRKDWLRNCVKYFADPSVAGVGGPGITPEQEDPMKKASGYVLSSFMVGSISSRYKAERIYQSDDIHSCNFIAQKKALDEVGGWNEKYWPGEDTLLCLALRKHGMKLIEASDVVVYHHRRPLLIPHLKQISRFGLHRGFFAKTFPDNSLKLSYATPSLLVISLLIGLFSSLISVLCFNILVLGIIMYLALSGIAAVIEIKKVKLTFLVWLGIITTHVVYGISFLVGLTKRDLAR
jgi:cellulose synthase/poly-beta-1,6-N-acetylglucosamine synthase-like glycosyltransferase